MKPARDPKRWSEPGSAGPRELASAIHELRAQQGSMAQVEALASRLAPQLTAPTSAGSATAWSSWIKIGGALLLTGAIAIYALTRGGEARPESPRVARAPLPPTTITAQETRANEQPPSPPIATEQAPQPPPPAKTAVKPRVARSARRNVPEAAAPAPESELVLLQRSQAALDRDPNAALALAEQHARAYPKGAFSQEREILALEALLKLRRAPAALARAERFVREYPESPHSQRVRALLARSRSLVPAANAATIEHDPIHSLDVPGSRGSSDEPN